MLSCQYPTCLNICSCMSKTKNEMMKNCLLKAYRHFIDMGQASSWISCLDYIMSVLEPAETFMVMIEHRGKITNKMMRWILNSNKNVAKTSHIVALIKWIISGWYTSYCSSKWLQTSSSSFKPLSHFVPPTHFALESMASPYVMVMSLSTVS